MSFAGGTRHHRVFSDPQPGALLITVAISAGTVLSRRWAEQKMYGIGDEYAAALNSYRLVAMNGVMVNGPRRCNIC